MLGHEARALDEHAARTACWVEDAAVERFEDFDEESDDAARCIELAAARTLVAGELSEEVFVDASKRVALCRHGDFRDLLQKVLQQRAVEQLVGLRQDACELTVGFLDIAHRLVD